MFNKKKCQNSYINYYLCICRLLYPRSSLGICRFPCGSESHFDTLRRYNTLHRRNKVHAVLPVWKDVHNIIHQTKFFPSLRKMTLYLGCRCISRRRCWRACRPRTGTCRPRTWRRRTTDPGGLGGLSLARGRGLPRDPVRPVPGRLRRPSPRTACPPRTSR